jgi:pimeloyl-ACP methyl ester carboxylesterase
MQRRASGEYGGLGSPAASPAFVLVQAFAGHGVRVAPYVRLQQPGRRAYSCWRDRSAPTGGVSFCRSTWLRYRQRGSPNTVGNRAACGILPARVTIVSSSDGTAIAYTTTGTGPGLILVPGALAVAADFTLLAHALADTFTVHVIERRGRGASGPQGDRYTIASECADLQAVQSATGAALVFGHSFGGLVALEAAIGDRDLHHVAVFEPGVSIDGSVPIAWAARCRSELDAGRPLDAFVTFARGVNPKSAGRAPRWLLKRILALAIRGPEREQKFRLLAGTIHEHAEAARLDGTAERYRQISAEILLMSGRDARGTARATHALAELLPAARTTSLERCDHFAPEKRPELVAEHVKAAFAHA